MNTTGFTDTTTVNVEISTIIHNVDVSILGVTPPLGYVIQKTPMQDLAHYSDIVDGKGKLDTKYYTSRIIERNGLQEDVFFLTLCKNDSFTVPCPEVPRNLIIIEEKPFCEEEISKYREHEFSVLNDFISKLQLFHSGDITLSKIWYDFHCSIGRTNYSLNKIEIIEDANLLGLERYALSGSEINDCNAFLLSNHYSFEPLRNVINEFTYSQKLLDASTRLEQITTVFEMICLGKNQQSKKVVLAKRVASLLKANSTDVLNLYIKMCNYYKQRSESTHEGIPVTSSNVIEYEGIARDTLKRYLAFTETELSANPHLTYDEIKDTWVDMLKNMVAPHNAAGLFPA
jgi:hypothetical protein